MAIRSGDREWIQQMEELLRPYEQDHYHVSGFAHPLLPIFTGEDLLVPKMAYWGLIPFWVKDEVTAKKLMNQTLNARGETIFEKPSFRNAAKKKRAVLFVEGFYEHHHQAGKTFPYYIFRKDGEPMALACIWESWTNKETGEVMDSFSIVTTVGNEMMATIHNNPKAKGPRMPVVLSDNDIDTWRSTNSTKETIEALIQPYNANDLSAHSVKRLRGKEAVGNVPEANEAEEYEEVQAVYN